MQDPRSTLNYALPAQTRLLAFRTWLKKSRRILLGLFIALILYVGCYIPLSIYGRYEPYAIGLDWVKDYGWAPAGYVNNYKFNRPMFYFFAPLWAIDVRVWHRWDDWDSGKYPVHAPVDLDDVRRAWHR